MVKTIVELAIALQLCLKRTFDRKRKAGTSNIGVKLSIDAKFKRGKPEISRLDARYNLSQVGYDDNVRVSSESGFRSLRLPPKLNKASSLMKPV